MTTFTCPWCGARSANPNDVREGYCGRCHAFTSRSALGPDQLVSSTDDLALVLGGAPSSFTGHLLRLYAKADPGNRARLAAVFPYEAIAYETWLVMSPIPTVGQLLALLAEVTSASTQPARIEGTLTLRTRDQVAAAAFLADEVEGDLVVHEVRYLDQAPIAVSVNDEPGEAHRG